MWFAKLCEALGAALIGTAFILVLSWFIYKVGDIAFVQPEIRRIKREHAEWRRKRGLEPKELGEND